MLWYYESVNNSKTQSLADKEEIFMGIIDLIMGWGVVSEETPVKEVEIQAFDSNQ